MEIDRTGGNLDYRIDRKICPKARPRLGKGRAYLPANYRDWKTNAIAQLKSQPQPSEPIAKCEISIAIGGGGQRGDLDNIAGACLDALVQAGILVDDRISVVNKLSIEYFRELPPGASIAINNSQT